MSDLYRSRTMDQISEADIGKELKIAGLAPAQIPPSWIPSVTTAACHLSI